MNHIRFNEQAIQPSKIVCIGKNYMAHIQEMESAVPAEPVIFIKPNSAISTEIQLGDDEVHYEGELSFIVENGEIAGVAFGLDLTKRQIQKDLKDKGLPWERSKAFDGAAQFSDFVPFAGSTESLRLALYINGELKQQGGYDLMLYKPEALLQEVKRYFTLVDGDILMTGTPSGVGKINQGDIFEGKVFADDELVIEKTWQVM